MLVATYDDRQETPLTYNWNFTLEREVVPEWLVRAAYVGSASLYGRITKQLNPAVYIPGSTLGTDARRLFAPDLGSVNYYTQDRRSNYHSLQLSVTKRFSRGFTVLASYTFSKSIDNFGRLRNALVLPERRCYAVRTVRFRSQAAFCRCRGCGISRAFRPATRSPSMCFTGGNGRARVSTRPARRSISRAAATTRDGSRQRSGRS